MERVGVNVGRSRKPFLEKTTNLFLKLPNKTILDLLECFEIQHDVPDLNFKTEDLNLLSDEIRNILEEKIKNCKKID